jgi:hypothetical protein
MEYFQAELFLEEFGDYIFSSWRVKANVHSFKLNYNCAAIIDHFYLPLLAALVR